MSGGFQHDIAGGQGNLIISQLQSPNFSLTGKTGWAILKNGNAYFFNIVAQGTVTATAFIGTDFEITATGQYFYVGTPGAGNPPVFVISNGTSLTDPFGNTYLPTDVIVDTVPFLLLRTAAGSYIQMATSGPLGAFMALGSGDTSETQPGIMNAQVIGTGTARQLASTITSPQFAVNLNATLFLESASADSGATSGATIIGSLGQGGSFQLGLDNSGKPEFILGTNTPLKATHPGGANAETWQTMTLASGWTAMAGNIAPRYRLLATGELAIQGALTLPASGSYNSVTFATLATGYFRTDFAARAAISYLGNYPASYTAIVGSPRAFLSTSGGLQVSGLPSGENGQNVDISCTMDLT